VFFNIPKVSGSLREHVAALAKDPSGSARLDEASWIAKLHIAVRLRQQTLPEPDQG
jgi:hypothetical protein